ncbi:nickel pincer cofactor biosynthesis protein LarC [Nannocystaceae bacterium ST9]
MLLDPFGGLAGDMLLGGLLDLAGDRIDWLRAQLASLDLHDWSLEVEAAERRHIGCTRAIFHVPHEHDHRHLPDIRDRIAASRMPERAKAKAVLAFELLAEAEARVHRVPIDHVHFHEVGAADAILDICACSLLLDVLEVDELLSGPLPGGSGTIRCEHGDLPCPAPAVVNLLEDFVLLPGVGVGEMVTPTGAALLRAWGRSLRAGELATTRGRSGYGAGTRETSILRVTLSEVARSLDTREFEHDEVAVLETHIDDESPERLAWVAERLFVLGALDVAFAPLTMKKGRPAVGLTAIVPPGLREQAVALLLRESTALGVREQIVARTVLPRRITTVTTEWGEVRVKWAGGRARPEYEDLATVAREHDLTLHEVERAVLRACEGGPE